MDPKYPITNTQLPPNYHPITDQLLTNLPYRCRGVGRANGRVRVRIPGVTRGRRHGGPGGHRSGPGRARASRNQSFKRLFIIEQFKSGVGADRVERAGRWTRAPVGRAHGPEGDGGGARRARRRGHRRQSVPKRSNRKRRCFLHRRRRGNREGLGLATRGRRRGGVCARARRRGHGRYFFTFGECLSIGISFYFRMGNLILTYSVLFIVASGRRGVRGGGRGRPGAFARRRRRCVCMYLLTLV